MQRDAKLKSIQAKEVQQEMIRDEAEKLWECYSETGDSDYLENKKLTKCKTLNTKFDGADVIVPIKDTEGEIWSIQRITPPGDKYFLEGGKIQGCFHVVGNELQDGTRIYIAEGLATAAAIHEVLNQSVVVAFNAGNLEPVAQAIKEKYPRCEIVICCDNDQWKTRPDGGVMNVGKEKGKKAAAKVGGIAIVPSFQNVSSQPTDFWDLLHLEGAEAVSRRFEQLIEKPEKEERQSASTILVNLCAHVELFHTPEDEAYAVIPVKDHYENRAVYGHEFRKWLTNQFFNHKKSAPPSQALQDALATISGKACFEGEQHDVYFRTAGHAGKIYIDLGNEDWGAVKIRNSDFTIVKNPPVKFRRSKTSLPLPRPSACTNELTIEKLKQFLNLETDDDFKLVIAWLLSSFNPGGPYIVMVLYGEQGSSKSMMVQVLRALVDANQAPLRRPPKTTDDLMVSAKSNYVIAIDNMSHLSASLSDDFCCLATGGALSKRELYSNDSETVLFAKRPIILNGIDEFVVRGDLASRSIALSLPRIPENKRTRENDFWEKFDENKSAIMGALMNALSEALRNRDSLVLAEMPRMADAFHFATAAETAFGWESGSIMKAFKANQAVANSVVLNNSLIYPHLIVLADEGWEGTATVLMLRLNGMKGAFDFEPTWPRNPQSLSNRLRRLNPALRSVGILVGFDQTSGNDSDKIIHVRRIPSRNCDASDAIHLNSKRVECDSEIPENSLNEDPFFGPESQTSF